MITEYLRPSTPEEALVFLKRSNPKTLPLGGGSVLSKSQTASIAVVDLQLLYLDQIKCTQETIEIGATATLSDIEPAVKMETLHQVIRLQAGKNQRDSGTLAGLVNVADGRSPLLTLLLALDAQLIWEPGQKIISLEHWLPVRDSWHEASLITKIILPNVQVRYDFVARTPKDRPLVAIAAAEWPSGRIRIVAGGYGPLPVLAWDGIEHLEDIEKTVNIIYSEAEDLWASSSFRRETGVVLVKRLISDLDHDIKKRAI